MPELRRRSMGRASDQRWIGSRHALANARSSTLDPANFTAADHFPDGYIPSGTQVNAADESDLQPYTGAAGEKLRFVKDNHEVVPGDDGDGDYALLGVATIWHGSIDPEFLPVEFIAPPASESHQFDFIGVVAEDNGEGEG